MTPPATKAVILARGLGTRMRRPDPAAGLDERQTSIAGTGVKAMMPIGRPFLDYVLSTIADAGFRDVCLVIGPEHDAVREYYGAGPQRLLEPPRASRETIGFSSSTRTTFIRSKRCTRCA